MSEALGLMSAVYDVPVPGRAGARELRRKGIPYALILPAGLLVAAVTGYGIFYAIDFSFFQGFLSNKGGFVGLANYRTLWSDSTIRGDILTTFEYMAFAVPASVGLGLGFALLVNSQSRRTQLVRTILIVPWTTSLVITALLWGFILNPLYGPVTPVLRAVGLGSVDLLGPGWAMGSLVLASAWNAYAFSMILLLAALQQVPPSLIQSARVDGAGRLLVFWKITLPYVRPTLIVSLIMASMHYLNLIELPLILTGGGPGHSTEILPLKLYQEAFSFYHTGLASAMAVLILGINLAITSLYFVAMRDRTRLAQGRAAEAIA